MPSPFSTIEELQESTRYSPDREGSVDELIAYKDALEDEYGRLRETLDNGELSISFAGEASETFANWIGDHKRYTVRLTTHSGEQIEAVIYDAGTAHGSEWHDAVAFQYANESGEPILDRGIEIVRVRNVHVY